MKYASTIFLLKDNDNYIWDKTISKSIQSLKECNLKLTKKNEYYLKGPIQNSRIEDWNLMEKFWEWSIYNKLRCDPQEHYKDKNKQ